MPQKAWPCPRCFSLHLHKLHASWRFPQPGLIRRRTAQSHDCRLFLKISWFDKSRFFWSVRAQICDEVIGRFWVLCTDDGRWAWLNRLDGGICNRIEVEKQILKIIEIPVCTSSVPEKQKRHSWWCSATGLLRPYFSSTRKYKSITLKDNTT